MPIYDGNSVRFTAADHAPGSVQREIAERGSVGTVVAAPTIAQILDGLPHIKKYEARIENAWRDPDRGRRT